MARINLLDLDAVGLADCFALMGEPAKGAPMRARQVMRWMHRHGVDQFDGMSNIAKSLRDKLSDQACIEAPELIRDAVSVDGTRKFLFDVGNRNAIETVFIPEEDRSTLCISTQAGCALDCAFCSTGKQGFSRNLTVSELIGQLWRANQILRQDGVIGTMGTDTRDGAANRLISNVVLMGMGEPLTNLDNVIIALRLMLDDHAYGLSRRRVTVSTSGIVPAMDRLREACPVALAVSLHAPNDALRDRLVPINRKYPLDELMSACRRYLNSAPRDFITFEYVMLDDVNDHDGDARALLRLTRDVPCKFNLIPFNPFPGSVFRQSKPDRVRRFAEILLSAGIVTTTRKRRGDDIDAACGQLAGRVQNRRSHNARHGGGEDAGPGMPSLIRMETTAIGRSVSYTS